MNHSVLLAIFKRNFTSYFLNPTGYVFICVFVLLSSLAAFWPNEFFTSNLANLDQLNKYFPLIMLIFIPAITMSIWAEERRQGTDELLLTIPATDFDVVMGKYLAAVAIYATALLFSLVCNFTILSNLGEPDKGLFFSTYVGYFMVGLAMLSIGMVASFLTSNITVGFVLGAIFCAIPIGLDYVEVILTRDGAAAVRKFGIAEQLRDFTQGVCSLSSMAYFTSITAIMLYLSIVLIGRRHWVGGRDGQSLGPHYLARTLSLAAAAAGLLLLTQAWPGRLDVTAEGLSTLSGSTKKVVAELDKKRPIHIEAFVSPNPPKEFVPLRLDLITRLREIAAQAGSNVSLRINETQPFTEEADRAEKLYGITGREIDSLVRGQYTKDTVFLGVAITSGLDKIVIPFVESSTPIEYEVMRSIATLNGSTRKRLGIFIGDKTTFQEFDPETRQPRDPEIVRELRKQYDVVDLDAEKPVPDNIDVLMAIQPTLWRPSQLDQLVTAVRRGVPTLIFQDPLPVDYPQMLQQEQQANGGMPFIQDSETKKLWDLLGVESGSQQIVTHEYNPLQHVQQFPPGYVFIGNGALGKNNAKQSLFDEKDPISANTEAVVFIFGGWVSKKKDATLTFTPLVHTSTSSGYVDRAEMFTQTMLGQTLNPNVPRHKTGLEYAMVARIQGTAPAEAKTDVNIKRLADEQPTTGGAASKGVAKNELLLAQAPAASPTATASATARPAATGPSATDPAAAATPSATAPVAIPAATAPLSPVGSPSPTGVPATIVNPYVVPVATASSTPTATGTAAPAGTATAAAPKKDRPMDVVIITDLDFMGYQFFRLRNQRPTSVDRVPNFDNITIVLNALDSLAGDNRFIEVRNRRPHHRTLTTLDAINMRSADDRNKQKVDKNEQMEEEYKKEDARLEEEYKKLVANTTLKQMDKQSRLEIFSKDRERRLNAKRAQLKIRLEKEDKELARIQNDEIRNRQDRYKAFAVFIPPIFPLLIGLAVFFSRRAGEQEGVDRSRLR